MNHDTSNFRSLGRGLLFCLSLVAYVLPALNCHALVWWHVHNAGAGSISWNGIIGGPPPSPANVQVGNNCPPNGDQWMSAASGYTWQSAYEIASGTQNAATITSPAGNGTNHAYWKSTGAWATTNEVVWDDATSTWGPPLTNGYAFAYISWTNKSAEKGAMLDWGVTSSNGVSQQMGEMRYVAPGQTVGFWATNFGSGGQFYWGNTRQDQPEDLVQTWGTWVGTGSGSSSGHSGTPNPSGGSFTNVTVTQTGGTGTNGLTQGVFQGGALGIMQGIASLEFTTAKIGSNLLGALNGLGTNSFGGTNFDDASIWTTNVYDQAVSNQARSDFLYMSNLISGGSNLIAAYSNHASVWSANSDVAAINVINADASAAVTELWDGLSYWLTEPDADDEWGVLHITPDPGGFKIDFKRALSLAVIDDKIAGFSGWVRILIMWGALLVTLRTYLDELRYAVWQALSITPTPNLGMQLLSSLGAMVGGVGGYAAGTVAGHFVKAGTTIAMFVAVLFFPAIIIVAAETLFTFLGMSSGWFLTHAADVLNAPEVMTKVMGCTAHWFPVIPLLAIACNYFLMKIAMDAVVSSACVWLKLAVPA